MKDYANVAYSYQQALRSVGVNTVAFSSMKAGLKYPQTAEHFRYNQGSLSAANPNQRNVFEACKKAKVIIWMHSQYVDLGLPRNEINKKKLIVFHGGTSYRLKYNSLNRVFNPMVEKSLIQTLDLWGLGAKNQVWMLPAVDTDILKPTFQPMRRRRIIAHYPHVPIFKGSDIVIRALNTIESSPDLVNKFECKYSDTPVSWSENIERMRGCDIYIESLSRATTWNQHDWSVTALEAAALGKIVVTNMLEPERYKREYGFCALHVANTENQLVNVLRKLLMIESDAEIQRLKSVSREWVVKTHGYRAIGLKLKKILGV